MTSNKPARPISRRSPLAANLLAKRPVAQVSAANQRLALAHVKLAEAQGILADAKIASEGGRKFSDQVEVELAGHVRKNEDLAASRAAELKRAMKLGGFCRSSKNRSQPLITSPDARRKSGSQSQSMCSRSSWRRKMRRSWR